MNLFVYTCRGGMGGGGGADKVDTWIYGGMLKDILGDGQCNHAQ